MLLIACDDESTKYTVTFDSNGGTAVSSQKVENGKTATEPVGQIQEGKSIKYWTLNGERFSFDTPITSSIELVAVWGDVAYGDRGPAGGYIFYDVDADNDSGNTDNLTSSGCNWRYLEAAPSDLSEQYIFGYYRPDGNTNTNLGTETGIGKGDSNTKALNDKADETYGYSYDGSNEHYFKIENYAAKACSDYIYGGKDDWFLPSKEELNLMYENLHEDGFGNFKFTNNEWYWSSSESSNTNAYAYSFGNKSSQTPNRAGSWYVRPIRAFK